MSMCIYSIHVFLYVNVTGQYMPPLKEYEAVGKRCFEVSQSEILLDVITFVNVEKSTQQATGISVETNLEVLCIKVTMDFSYKIHHRCQKHNEGLRQQYLKIALREICGASCSDQESCC